MTERSEEVKEGVKGRDTGFRDRWFFDELTEMRPSSHCEVSLTLHQ